MTLKQGFIITPPPPPLSFPLFYFCFLGANSDFLSFFSVQSHLVLFIWLSEVNYCMSGCQLPVTTKQTPQTLFHEHPRHKPVADFIYEFCSPNIITREPRPAE